MSAKDTARSWALVAALALGLSACGRSALEEELAASAPEEYAAWVAADQALWREAPDEFANAREILVDSLLSGIYDPAIRDALNALEQAAPAESAAYFEADNRLARVAPMALAQWMVQRGDGPAVGAPTPWFESRRREGILRLGAIMLFAALSSVVGGLWARRSARKAEELAVRLGRD